MMALLMLMACGGHRAQRSEAHQAAFPGNTAPAGRRATQTGPVLAGRGRKRGQAFSRATRTPPLKTRAAQSAAAPDPQSRQELSGAGGRGRKLVRAGAPLRSATCVHLALPGRRGPRAQGSAQAGCRWPALAWCASGRSCLTWALTTLHARHKPPPPCCGGARGDDANSLPGAGKSTQRPHHRWQPWPRLGWGAGGPAGPWASSSCSPGEGPLPSPPAGVSPVFPSLMPSLPRRLPGCDCALAKETACLLSSPAPSPRSDLRPWADLRMDVLFLYWAQVF